MFTGLVKNMGEVRLVTPMLDGGLSLEIAGNIQNLAVGASVLHSGVCLTVRTLSDSGWSVDVSPETLSCTNIAHWKAGTPINLEPSLKLGDSLDGHFVFGHVDAVAKLHAIYTDGASRRLSISMPAKLAAMIAHKGSIALDGISLTIAKLLADRFELAIIPHTWEATTLHTCATGHMFNLEIDMLARYVSRQLEIDGKT